MARVLGWLMAVLMAASVFGGAALAEDDLAGLAGRLSAGDVSVLVAALKTPESQMMTMDGSANDAFWSALERLGLMQQHQPPEAMAKALEGAGMKAKIFSVTAKGAAEIPALLAKVRKQ